MITKEQYYKLAEIGVAAAKKRAKRQGFCGNVHLQNAMEEFLRIGFEDGADVGRALTYAEVLNDPVVTKMKEALQELNFHLDVYRTEGGIQQVLIAQEKCFKALVAFEAAAAAAAAAAAGIE
jgi:hypothetical protein